jgi:hypothetical protein
MLKRRLGNLRAWLRRLWRALRSAPPDDWESTELQVQGQMSPYLASYLALVQRLDNLAFRVLRGLKPPPLQPESVTRAHLSLLTRVLQDLRAAAILAERGYTMQSWSVAASAFEAAHTMGFIAVDSVRADKWLAHTDLSRPFVSVKSGVEGSFRYLEIGKQGKRRVAAVEHEYNLYERLCIAKHVNPISERNRYIGERAGSARLTITPYASERRIREARLGLLLAVRSGVLALWVFRQAHAPDDSDAADSLTEIANKTAEQLRNWKDLDA